MKKTTIVYQDKLALPDVYRWAADNKFTLFPGKRGPLHYVVKREDELINIIPHTYDVMEIGPCEKLVLWGAFNQKDLEKLMEYLK